MIIVSTTEAQEEGENHVAKFFSVLLWYSPEITGIMRSLLYIIAVLLVIGWLLGVFYFSAGRLIHILLILAIISLLFGIIRRA